ncbi:MAG: exosortase-associated EpsI family protein [Verrucomicrobiales bacterium]
MKPIVAPPSRVTRRLAALFLIVLAGLSTSFLLPDRPKMRDCAIAMSLPAEMGFWRGFSREPGKEELEKLAEDTQFEKKEYLLIDPLRQRPMINSWHAITASIVQSGQDLNSSIHRPERCLPAQGFKDLRSQIITLTVDGRPLKITRLRCFNEPTDPKTGRRFALPDGGPLRIQHVIYYWFVGTHVVTPNHSERTLVDMKDRLIGGYDQHWSYVMLTGAFTDDLVHAGAGARDEFYPEGRTESETDDLLKQLTEAISRHSMRWSQVDG